MRRRKRRFSFFLLSILSFAGLAYLILFYPPSSQFSIFPALPAGRNFQFSIVTVFFLLFSLTIFSVAAYLSNNTVRGIIYAASASLYLYLRLIDLTHPFFLILLLSLLVTVEFVLRKR